MRGEQDKTSNRTLQVKILFSISMKHQIFLKRVVAFIAHDHK